MEAKTGIKKKLEGDYYIVGADKVPSKSDLKEAISVIKKNIEIMSRFNRHQEEVSRLRAVVTFLELILHKMS